MKRSSCIVLAIAAVVGDLYGQSNERGAGYNGALTNISSARAWGRRGAAFPGGEVGLSFQNELCNPGTVPVEWRAPMQPDHPFFSFLVVRDVNGRLEQISDWSYCKHAFLSLNSPSTCGGSCVQPPAGGAQLGINCSDVYTNSNNGSRTYLGPPAEINPWLGTWNPVGSYFDIGDPATGVGPADGVRSLVTTGFDTVKNRVTVREAALGGTVTSGLFFQIQVLHQGERVNNRGNNIMSRPFGLTWNGATWTASTSGTASLGTVLTQWPGATIGIGGDGTGTFTDNDGRFQVAVKVTGPTAGKWHYEYCVLNIDNSRGGATFRLPVCGGASISGIGFRDIDQDPLNDWTSSVSGGQITWSAPANNAQRWNQLFNFSFDSDVAPVAGNASIDHALPGPGNLTVTVPTQVPGLQTQVTLGAGCGTPATNLYTNGVPSPGNLGFALQMASAPATPALLYFSLTSNPTTLAPGCTVYMDLGALITVGLYVTDGAGIANVPIPISATQTPVDLYLQAATLIPSPPLFGLVGLSSGLKIRVAGTGCN
jgi:hypothetical protein